MTNYQLPDFSSSDDSTSPMVDTPGYPPGYWNGFYSPFEHAPPYHYVPHYPIPRTEIPTSPPRPLPVMEHSPPIFSPEAFEDYGSEKNYFPHTFSEGNSPDNFFFIHRNSDSQPEGSFEQKQTKKSCKKLYNKKERNNVDPKKKKRCSNCSTTKSPSWRRSTLNETKENLLCNACGL
ncbi:hypothetical protein G6F56_011965 [Rhizopus delemar]|nr:hypothetical protein G6F56_011965 [Rhizopus delemar]